MRRLSSLRGVAQFGRALGSGPRGRVFKSHHSDQYKCPETVYSCGFRAFSFFCGFRRFSPLTHTVTHTGTGRTQSVLLRKPLAGRNAWPAFCGKPQNHAFLAIVCSGLSCRFLLSYTRHFSRNAPRWRFSGLGWLFLSPRFPPLFRSEIGAFLP